MIVEILSKSEEETINIAKYIADFLFKGAVLTLSGDLGAGKTTFTKGVGLGLGVTEEINSPTFNILKCYFNNKLNLYHIDAYRLEGVASENKNIGLEEVIEGDGVCLIEWPQFIDEFIPFDSLQIQIFNNEDGSRRLVFASNSAKYYTMLVGVKDNYENV